MKTRLIITALAAVMMLSCKEKNTTTHTIEHADAAIVDKDAIRADIQKLEDGFATAMNSRDADGIAAYYAVDAQSFITGTQVLSGKQAIIDAAKNDFERIPKDGKIEYTMIDLFISNDGSQVVEVGSYRASDKAGTLKRKGNYMSTFEKREGKYVCIRDIDSPR